MSHVKIAIVGSRDYKNIESVRQFVFCLPADAEVVSGGGGIVDQTAEKTAQLREVYYSYKAPKIFHANWAKHGKAAGPIRNREITKYADICVAFWDGLSRGTKSCIDSFLELGKEVYLFNERENTFNSLLENFTSQYRGKKDYDSKRNSKNLTS